MKVRLQHGVVVVLLAVVAISSLAATASAAPEMAGPVLQTSKEDRKQAAKAEKEAAKAEKEAKKRCARQGICPTPTVEPQISIKGVLHETGLFCNIEMTLQGFPASTEIFARVHTSEDFFWANFDNTDAGGNLTLLFPYVFSSGETYYARVSVDGAITFPYRGADTVISC